MFISLFNIYLYLVEIYRYMYAVVQIFLWFENFHYYNLRQRKTKIKLVRKILTTNHVTLLLYLFNI